MPSFFWGGGEGGDGSFKTRNVPREFMNQNLGRTPKVFTKRQEVEIRIPESNHFDRVQWCSAANTGKHKPIVLTCELSVACSGFLSSRILKKRGNLSEIPLTGST